MADIFRIDRPNNKIELGTTGTTINVDSHTASTILGLDASKDLESLAIPLIVANGGSGAATLTDHGILLGSGTGAITPLGVAANGKIPIGSAGADPVLAEITGTANQIISTPGVGSITLSLPQDIHTGASPTLAGLELTGNLNLSAASATITVGGASWGKLENQTKLYLNYDNPTAAIQVGKVGNSLDFTIFGNIVMSDGVLTLKEQAAADGDTAAYGQVWCKTATPNELWFVNDVGTEVRIAPQDLQVTASPTFSTLLTISYASVQGYIVIGESLYIEERAAANDDVGGYGQIWVKSDTPNTLWFTDDGGTDYPISPKTLTFSTAGPTDNVDVTGINTLFLDTSSNSITIGGFAGGVDGQVLYVARTSNVNNAIIEHDEAEATQKIFLHAGADETLGTEYGGWIFVCHGGTDWHDCSHAKHVP